ncbi:MAG: hypothetical protein WC455_19750 [Dehalococcoidia bacterium]|jgi:hypothetical protein
MTRQLGKLAPRIDVRTIKLARILKTELLPVLPAAFDLDNELGGIQDNNTFNNMTYGDCVIAGRAHMTLRFEKFEQGLIIPGTDKDVVDQYFKESGGVDSGLIMLNSLNSWRKDGWTFAGKKYDIYAYAAVDIQNHSEAQYCIYLLRGAYLGINMPLTAQKQLEAGQVWDYVPNDSGNIAGSWGGHCVYVQSFDGESYTCITWGQKQKMTKLFWEKYVDECYGIIDNRNSFMENSPVDVSKLSGILNEITTEPVNPSPTPITPGCNPFSSIMKIFKKEKKHHG